MESIYHQYFEEPRYRPSVITSAAFGWRLAWVAKPGQGFYSYHRWQGPSGLPKPPAPTRGLPAPGLGVLARGQKCQSFSNLLKDLGAQDRNGVGPFTASAVFGRAFGV